MEQKQRQQMTCRCSAPGKPITCPASYLCGYLCARLKANDWSEDAKSLLPESLLLEQ